MTTLRELFKKSKQSIDTNYKKVKDGYNKVLDADLEKNYEKISNKTKKFAEEADTAVEITKNLLSPLMFKLGQLFALLHLLIAWISIPLGIAIFITLIIIPISDIFMKSAPIESLHVYWQMFWVGIASLGFPYAILHMVNRYIDDFISKDTKKLYAIMGFIFGTSIGVIIYFSS